MQIYDYRHELIELLENTSSDQQSLRQTLQSLNTVINILNHYEDPQPSTSPQRPKQFAQPENKAILPAPRIRQASHSYLLNGPAHKVTPNSLKRPVTPEPVTVEKVSQ